MENFSKCLLVPNPNRKQWFVDAPWMGLFGLPRFVMARLGLVGLLGFVGFAAIERRCRGANPENNYK